MGKMVYYELGDLPRHRPDHTVFYVGSVATDLAQSRLFQNSYPHIFPALHNNRYGRTLIRDPSAQHTPPKRSSDRLKTVLFNSRHKYPMSVRKTFVRPSDLAYNAVLPRADRALDILVWEAPKGGRELGL
jgi:hypothetical protein